MLKIEDIHFSYRDKNILNGLSFSVEKGEIIALIGTSGSGKTTLFRLVTGLMAPDQGEILINGHPLPLGAQLITYMRQDDLLLPWRTVLGNLLLFAELGRQKVDNTWYLKQASILLKKMGLENTENLYPKDLSGGMRQRVALARSLLQNRPVMLLDEPFASLDVIMREQLYILLRDIRDQYQKTILMVTHDFRDAMALADRILVLAQGNIVGSFALSSQTSSEWITKQIRHLLTLA